ncbi:MAG: sel1 repeat family protein [Leptospiraceae bacterium]|nr:sel1 repeat family protein [Leptospiraceae bacterium]
MLAEVITSNGVSAASLPKCKAKAAAPGWFTMKIIEAHLSDRPLGLSGLPADSNIKAYWVAEYAISSEVSQPATWSDSWMANELIDENGMRWGGMRDRRTDFDDSPFSLGEEKRGRLVFMTYKNPGNPQRVHPYISGTFKIPHPNASKSVSKRVTLDFGRIPTNCSDTPPSITEIGPSTAELVVPRQVLEGAVIAPTADPNSVKYAVQVAMIWAFGQGVYPDFEQALVWYREGERRQTESGDHRHQNEIKQGIYDLTNNDVAFHLERGQRSSDREDQRFYFGRAAYLGDIQGMAALGWVYGERFKNPGMQIYWCRKAFRSWRLSREDFEIDAINHFCPLETFDVLMTSQERAANEVSRARAKAKYEELKRDAEFAAELARVVVATGSSDAEAMVERDIRAARDYASGRRSSPPPAPPINDFYGSCHGGAFYGC